MHRLIRTFLTGAVSLASVLVAAGAAAAAESDTQEGLKEVVVTSTRQAVSLAVPISVAVFTQESGQAERAFGRDAVPDAGRHLRAPTATRRRPAFDRGISSGAGTATVAPIARRQ
jgi:hypothetical protein